MHVIFNEAIKVLAFLALISSNESCFSIITQKYVFIAYEGIFFA
jgi:hypothetical protein